LAVEQEKHVKEAHADGLDGDRRGIRPRMWLLMGISGTAFSMAWLAWYTGGVP